MISTGSNIKSSTDELKTVSIEYLYGALKNPKENILSTIRQLRIVKELSTKHYNELKITLPYIVCASFQPAFRRTENFAYTDKFIIDIDHIVENGMSISGLKEKLKRDDRVLLFFISPGGDGLKVMLKLKERCYDAAKYKMFYQLFVAKFSEEYELKQVIDIKTCDVTRACFLSCDSDAYYNPRATPVVLEDYLNSEDDLTKVKEKIKEVSSMFDDINSEVVSKEPEKADMDEIRKTLNPKLAKYREKPQVFVPQALNDIVEDLVDYIEKRGIVVTAINDISYGKKFSFSYKNKTAEVNLFFGKHGFKAIKSPKTGTDPDFNEVMIDVIESFLCENI